MNKKEYLREIAERSCVKPSVRKRLMEDISTQYESLIAKGCSDIEVMERMGEPDTIAAELFETYYASCANELTERPFIEYKSRIKICGLPLIHAVFIRKFGRGSCIYNIPVARGIIAIGNIAVGVFATGNVAIGLITISNVGFGLIALGNLVTSPFFSFGNLSAASLSMGNMAVGYAALGNAGIGVYGILNYVFAGVNTVNTGYTSLQSSEISTYLNQVPEFVKIFFEIGIGIMNNKITLACMLVGYLIILLFIWIYFRRKAKKQ